MLTNFSYDGFSVNDFRNLILFFICAIENLFMVIIYIYAYDVNKFDF